MVKKSSALKFSFDVSERFVDECAAFLDLPTDDSLTRVSAQLFASNFSLRDDLTRSVDDLTSSVHNLTTQAGDRWNEMQTSTLTVLNTTVQTVGQVSTRHQDISLQLTRLTDLYERSLTDNQQLQEKLLELTELYQRSLNGNRELQNLYQISQQENLKLHANLETLIGGLSANEEVKVLQDRDLHRSITELANSSQKPAKEVLLYLQKMERSLNDLNDRLTLERELNRESNPVRAIKEIGERLKKQITDSIEPTNEAVMMLKIARKETRDFLSNFQIIFGVLCCSVVFLLGVMVWHAASDRAALSAYTANVNAFGGEVYHRVALRIMDSEYRNENLQRLDNCRFKNKKIQSPVMECYLKVERS